MPSEAELPKVAIDYIVLLGLSYEHYHDVRSHEEYSRLIGKDKLLDVSSQPKYQMMENSDPVPLGFSRRVYHFKTTLGSDGSMDVVFRGEVLSNIRAQVFFGGFFAARKARKYLHNVVLPQFRAMFGAPVAGEPGNYCFASPRIVAVARFVPGAPSWPSVSCYLMDANDA